MNFYQENLDFPPLYDLICESQVKSGRAGDGPENNTVTVPRLCGDEPEERGITSVDRLSSPLKRGSPL